MRVKRLAATILALLLLAQTIGGLAPAAYAGTDDYPSQWRDVALDSVFDTWGHYNRECTSFVSWRLHSRNGFEMPFHGNASDWGDRARARGFTVDKTPAVGAVMWQSYGHVAWVESVNAGGTITVEEYNWRVGNTHDGAYHERTILASAPTGYIHFKDMDSPLSDGLFVMHGRDVFRMVGGAPLYVSSWAPFGGGQPTIALSDARWSRLPQYPRDGSFVRGIPSGQIYRIVGGAPLYVSDWATYGGLQPSVEIGDDTIRNAGALGATAPWNHLLAHPSDGAYVMAKPSGNVYRLDQGAPARITDWAAVGGPHPTVVIGDETILKAGTADQTSPWSHLRARLSGTDRFAASATVSAESFAPGRDVVYIASGLNFPDALSGAPVAARHRAPILLVQPDAIPAVIQAELTRLGPANIVILGGMASVSDTVASELGAFATGKVTRLAGEDRYAASAAISAANFTVGPSVAYVASGLSFPDALSGAPAAAKNGAPILLVAPDEIPPAIEAELRRLRPDRIVVLGGASSVSEHVETLLAGLTLGNVTRLAGSDRFAASAAISAANYSPGAAVVYLSSGLNFPDALSGAPLAAVNGAPILLVHPAGIPASVQAEINRLRPLRIVVLGGGNSVPGAILP